METTLGEKVLTVEEAAQRLRVSDQTIRNHLESGYLKGYRITPGLKGSPWFVYLWSVEEYEERRRRGDTGPLGNLPK